MTLGHLIITIGITGNYGDTLGDFYLIKTDLNGDTLWTKTYGTTGVEWRYAAQQTADNGYIITGSSDLYNNQNSDVYLVKTDNNGNLLWSKTYGGTSGKIGYSVKQTSDGGYIIGGVTQSFGAGMNDLYLIKVNNSGNIIWIKTFGGTLGDFCSSVQQTSDGGFILAGTTNSFGVGMGDVILIKTDVNGNLQWLKFYGSTGNEFGFSAQQTSDLGYIVTGISQGFATFHTNAYLIKTDGLGSLQWSKTYDAGGNENLFSVQQTVDLGFIMGGTLVGNIDSDIGLIKTDNNGNLLWSKSYGSTNFDDARSIRQTNDGGYIIAGHTESFGVGAWDNYLIKTDSIGNSGCSQNNVLIVSGNPATQVTTSSITVSAGVSIYFPITSVSFGGAVTSICMTTEIKEDSELNSYLNIYPNPTSGIINVNFLNKKIDAKIYVYDLLGNCIMNKYFQNEVSNTIDLSFQAKGIYILEISSKNQTSRKKIILQ